MPTKRPDQLPEEDDFSFEDILMVEKFPDSEQRRLYKTKLRNFIESALKFDSERAGSNAILRQWVSFMRLMWIMPSRIRYTPGPRIMEFGPAHININIMSVGIKPGNIHTSL